MMAFMNDSIIRKVATSPAWRERFKVPDNVYSGANVYRWPANCWQPRTLLARVHGVHGLRLFY